MRYFILVMALVSAQAQAQAGEWRANINLASHHFVEPPAGIDEWNEQNYGFGVERSFGEWFSTAGYYDNSFGDTTVYAGLGREWRVVKYVHVGAEAGLASGYDEYSEASKMIMVGDLAVIGDLYASFGRDHRIKVLMSRVIGFQYQAVF